MQNPFSRVRSLKKSLHVLRHVYHLFHRKKNSLQPSEVETIKVALEALQAQIMKKDKSAASELSYQAENLEGRYLRKGAWEKSRDTFFVLVFALCVAVLVRQVWFEFYEIPTGSMRPTLKEKDRIVVSKTTFGINVPLTTEHILFEPELVKRGGIFVFTGENMDIRDVDTTYFYLFPGKKQYVKRLMGRPGDILYFYGGQIFGIDSSGNDISPLLQMPELKQIEHIPFIRFKGNAVTANQPKNGIYSSVTFYQMNEPIARLSLNAQNQLTGEMLPICTSPDICSSIEKEYGDLWGIKNFAMMRLLTRDQVKSFYDTNIETLPEGVLYLEIKHNPSLKTAKMARDERGRVRPTLGINSSLIPLDEKHLKDIFNHMYTARFIVRNGFAFRYGMQVNDSMKNSFMPHLPNVPDGTYEFYYGKAYQIQWQGLVKELPPTHPLYKFDAERVQLFYNLGIEFDTRFSPQSKYQPINPSRFGYYRDGDLYLLGAPIFKKDDPVLINFIEREKAKASDYNRQYPYLPFLDYGPPLKADGSLDVDFIKQHGLAIPPKMYLALGDNHAMSSDSRDFGFVPENNIRGAPDWIFWPFGARFGYPNQPVYPFMNLPRSVVWACILIILAFVYRRHKRKNALPLDFGPNG